jgi:VanZ family protein
VERDTRRLAIASVTLGICTATLAPVRAAALHSLAQAGLALRGFADGSAFSLFDAAQNVLLFLPLGFLLGSASGRSEGLSPTRAALRSLLFSAALECAQAWIPGRFPSVFDVACNALGGGLGAWMAARAGLSAGSGRAPAQGAGQTASG